MGFSTQIPILLLAPFAGVWMDRISPLKVMKITQVMAMLQSGTMAVITLTGHMVVSKLVGLSSNT